VACGSVEYPIGSYLLNAKSLPQWAGFPMPVMIDCDIEQL
jgi:hypothetical protein